MSFNICVNSSHSMVTVESTKLRSTRRNPSSERGVPDGFVVSPWARGQGSQHPARYVFAVLFFPSFLLKCHHAQIASLSLLPVLRE